MRLPFKSFSFVPIVAALLASQTANGQDYDPEDHFHLDESNFESVRSEIASRIWGPGGLPLGAAPSSAKVTTARPSQMRFLDAGKVDEYHVLDGFYGGLRNQSFLLKPATLSPENNCLVVLHQGHGDFFAGNFVEVTESLLDHGYSVLAMVMPLQSWHASRDEYRTTSFDGGATVETFTNHNDLVNRYIEEGVSPLDPFVTPTVAGINYFHSVTENAGPVSMLGLSGGGWTTDMVAAMDTRISLSASIAGSRPIPLRSGGSIGDAEQQLPGIYPDYSYLDLYALGSLGSVGREQVKINHLRDGCCFSGREDDQYTTFVSSKSAELGGTWSFYRNPDTSTNTHHIRSDEFESQILPRLAALHVPEPSSALLLGSGALAFLLRRRRRR